MTINSLKYFLCTITNLQLQHRTHLYLSSIRDCLFLFCFIYLIYLFYIILLYFHCNAQCKPYIRWVYFLPVRSSLQNMNAASETGRVEQHHDEDGQLAAGLHLCMNRSTPREAPWQVGNIARRAHTRVSNRVHVSVFARAVLSFLLFVAPPESGSSCAVSRACCSATGAHGRPPRPSRDRCLRRRKVTGRRSSYGANI